MSLRRIKPYLYLVPPYHDLFQALLSGIYLMKLLLIPFFIKQTNTAI